MDSLASSAPPSSAGLPMVTDAQADEPQGILLYYKYVPLEGGDAEEVARFYTDMSAQLGLRGRIRVARDGVNVTVGGSMAALHAHTAAVTAHPLLRGGDIDFKLAPSGGPRNEATRTETKMDRLVVRLCEELVTLGPLARHRADPRVSTAPHLTPDQFHQMLQRAAAVAATPTAAAAPTDATAAAAAPEAPTTGPESPQAAPPPAAGPSPAAAVPGSRAVEGRDSGERAADAPGNGEAGGDSDRVAEGSGGGSDGGGGGGGGAPEPEGPVVLLDARNIYETRIGHFNAGPSVSLLDPRTRCFSDLPAWMDAHEELLRNRTVLMYCTGGVRCERASAYLREKGPDFSRVFQLSGGIQRYLERFPDGGFFRGKNFLYDDRIAVGPEDVQPASPGAVVGRCLQCGCAWDDYGARLRCGRCRLLVLVCDRCNAAHPEQQQQQQQQQEQEQHEEHQQRGQPASAGAAAAAGSAGRQRQLQLTHGSAPLLCELCSAAVAAGGADQDRDRDRGQQHQHVDGGAPESPSGRRRGEEEQGADRAAASPPVPGAAPPAPSEEGASTTMTTTMTSPADDAAAAAPPAAAVVAAAEEGATGGGPRRLRILCLHGFRQTAKQFQGRTCALRKKLRDLADFVFVDGPHTLPLFVKPQAAAAAAATASDGGGGTDADADATADTADEAGARGALVSHDADVADEDVEAFNDGGDADGATTAVEGGAAAAAPPPPLAAKRAWLLPPELYGGAAAAAPAGGWQEAPSYVDELQYTRQTEGWRESLAALRAALRRWGPFDGVFGFSQGASVAAVLCALQQQQQQRLKQQLTQPQPPQQQQQPDPDGCDFGFRFAILASGFPSPLPEHRQLLAEVGPLALPSLHVYGSGGGGGAAAAAAGGGDRQIHPRESEALAAAFSCGSSCAGGGPRRVTLVHQSGHLIPATKGHAATFRAFLSQFPAEEPGEQQTQQPRGQEQAQ
ncbi:hypothetical protein PLESTB_000399800 [Pleodorina starrii]|uniref:Rhodanese domain-containing protein n=1 Tax=Pleodorina starrii TaxID=330485 RepID=A0A9W6BFL7_9CHLO|nr:hypothetical protein PLESTB_000399800 [Pleodorina starrii]